MNLRHPHLRAWASCAGLTALVATAWVALAAAHHNLAAESSARPPIPEISASSTGQSITFRLATYNIRNYNSISRLVGGQYKPDQPKPEAEKTALRAVIRSAQPDVLALEEMGPAPFLEELRSNLAKEGLNYPYATLVDGPDPDRHVALLSRLKPEKIIPHEQIAYNLNGKPALASRGLLEVEFITNGHLWTLYVVHLKSKLTEDKADPESAVQRVGEAQAIRDVIRKSQPLQEGALVAVVGDFNDSRDSAPLKRFLELDGKPLLKLAPAADSRGEVWTLTYPHADQYERSDFVLLSPALMPMQKGQGRVMDTPDSTEASDHRMVWVDLTLPP